MSHQKYYDYLQSLGHVLKLDENGNVDAFGHDFENHNGPSCINCGASWCHHCEEDAQVCEKELNSPPDVYDIAVDTGDGIYHTAEVVHFQQTGSKRMIQVRIGEPQADDVRKDGWTRIESAPKDGFYVLGFEHGYGIKITWFDKRHDGIGGWRNHAHGWRPTHWQPLPAPPLDKARE